MPESRLRLRSRGQQPLGQFWQLASSRGLDQVSESFYGPILTTLALLLVCSLPLIRCWHLTHWVNDCREESVAADLLIERLQDG